MDQNTMMAFNHVQSHGKSRLLSNLLQVAAATCCWLLVIGCSDPATESEDTTDSPPVRRAETGDEPTIITSRELRRKLKANENAQFERSGNDIVEARLFQSGVKTIDALKGLPLRALDLGMTKVSDLEPIRGMPLRSLILENTPIEDLSPIEGMQLEMLYLQNTKVTNLSMLKGMPIEQLNLLAVPVEDLSEISDLPLKTLWIPRTNVTSISPLKGKTLVSLDVESTQVMSLEPLAGMTTLKRLNIAQTPITDLSPLKGLNLERITLTPENIQTGIEVIREMSSLSQILTSMQGPGQTAAEFWKKYDDGVWSDDSDSAKTPGDSASDRKSDESPSTKPADTEDKPEKSGEGPDAKAPSKDTTEADSAEVNPNTEAADSQDAKTEE